MTEIFKNWKYRWMWLALLISLEFLRFKFVEFCSRVLILTVEWLGFVNIHYYSEIIIGFVSCYLLLLCFLLNYPLLWPYRTEYSVDFIQVCLLDNSCWILNSFEFSFVSHINFEQPSDCEIIVMGRFATSSVTLKLDWNILLFWSYCLD